MGVQGEAGGVLRGSVEIVPTLMFPLLCEDDEEKEEVEEGNGDDDDDDGGGGGADEEEEEEGEEVRLRLNAVVRVGEDKLDEGREELMIPVTEEVVVVVVVAVTVLLLLLLVLLLVLLKVEDRSIASNGFTSCCNLPD